MNVGKVIKAIKLIREIITIIAIMVVLIIILWFSISGQSFQVVIADGEIKVSFIPEDSKNDENSEDNGITESSEYKPIEPKCFSSGDILILDNVDLYLMADTSSLPIKTVSGTFYVYDGKNINSFIRICPTIDHVEKKPIEKNVVGWVKIDDLKENSINRL